MTCNIAILCLMIMPKLKIMMMYMGKHAHTVMYILEPLHRYGETPIVV